MMEKEDTKSKTLEGPNEELTALRLPKFRAKQVYQWLHVKLVEGFDEMTNISKELQGKLRKRYDLKVLTPVDAKVSQMDGTRKYLSRLENGNVIESVLTRYKHGNSVCISSQVGCRMGCRFCAPTLDGLERNLTASEMLEQIYRIQYHTGEQVSNVVIMGSGEPMDNYDNVLRFTRLLSDGNGSSISQRNTTVFTCGIVPKVKELADENLQTTLVLSLHASNDAVRRSLMLIANRYTLGEVMEACHYYLDKTGRRLTFEYSLVSGVNDNLGEARAPAALIKDQHGHVNPIPVNPIKERDYIQSNQKAVVGFRNLFEKNGISVTIRREVGRDISGAYGQLRKNYLEENQSGESSPSESMINKKKEE